MHGQQNMKNWQFVFRKTTKSPLFVKCGKVTSWGSDK